MNSVDAWQAANKQFLATALGWLKQRLEQLATVDVARDVAVHSPPAQPTPRSWRVRLFRPAAASLPTSQAAPVAGKAERSDRVPGVMLDAEKAEHPPALVMLAQRLGLSGFERNVLLLCAAMELDAAVGPLCARAQRDPAKAYPTFALALSAFDDPAFDVLSPERPLRYWRLIDIHQPPPQPLIAAALHADERIVNYILGINYLDDRLTPLVVPALAEGGALPPSHQAIAETIGNHLRASAGRTRLPVIEMLGPDSADKLAIATAAAASLGLTLYRLTADVLPPSGADQDTFARLWEREGALLPIALFVEAGQTERTSREAVALRRTIGRGAGVVVLDVRDAWPDAGRDMFPIDIPKPTPAEQKGAWNEALGAEAAPYAARAAVHFTFDVPSIRRIAAESLAATRDHPDRLAEALWSGCLRRARPVLDDLAQLVESKADWDDLILPATEKTLLAQIAEQVEARWAVYEDWGFRERMSRGLGVTALFAGESGVGKTMAAEVIAKRLGLLLYRVDLSAVVSKYIGETEKRLRQLFDAAEDGGAILFFDEADALFGKRSEVKDSHDRYANIEINYLLQRMETFRNLAILATNMKGALDSAFVRRLRFIVNFPFPGVPERLAIWQKVFPAKTPTAGINFPRLARLNLTGGNIQNIAVNAAFLAVQTNGPVRMSHVVEAARMEFRKLEKPINEGEFRSLEAAEGPA